MEGNVAAADHVEENEGERGRWGRKLEYLLSVLGFIVGFGNIWRFPYMCMLNGGGAFLIPYLTFLVLGGLPVFFIESILGQFTAKPVNKVWGICPLLRGIGFGMMILLLNGSIYYNSILGWILYYLYSSVTSPLPWSHCGNPWNTDKCRAFSSSSHTQIHPINNGTVFRNTSLYNISSYNTNHTVLNKVGTVSAAEEFWRFKVIQASSGVSDVRSLLGHLSITTFIACFVIFVCICRGVKSVGKVVYVTASLPYILLLVLLVRGLTLPGSYDGIKFFLEPKFEKLLEIQVWIQAAVQVFYSLGPGWGGLITMASFNKFNNNCLRDSVILSFCGEGTSVFGGLVIFSVLGFMAHRADVPITEVVQSGPGLIFIAYPEGLAQLPLPNVWAFVFFITMFTVGLDTQFVSIETQLDALTDLVPIFKSRKILYRGVAIVIFYLLNLLYCTQAGIYWFQLTDWYVACFANFVFSLFGCLIFGWLYGTERITRDLKLMLGRGLPLFMRICWCFVTPFIILCILLVIFASYKPPKYGNYEYPEYTHVLGWILACSPMVPVLAVAFKTLRRSPGKSFKEKLIWSIQPSEEWTPALESARDGYCNHYNSEQSTSLLKRVKLNVFGQKELV